MQKIFKRALAVLLTICVLLSSLVLVASAKGESRVRFVFSALTSSGNRRYETKEDAVELTLGAADRTFHASDVRMLATDSNALYISLVNLSGADQIHVTYTYEENNVEKTAMVSHKLEKYSEKTQSFFVKTPYITNRVSAMEISFSSDSDVNGRVILNAVFNTSTYFDTSGGDATYAMCHYDAEQKAILITGELSYEATVYYAGQTLALFALAADEELHLSNKTPIARVGVTFDFSFTVDATVSDALFYRYVVAAVNEKGERIPLCTPMFPTIKDETSAQLPGFKGFHTGELSTVISCDPDVEIVDIYLDRLHSTQSNGILYAGEHSYYYFDQKYVGEIDKRVKNLTGIGARVYLRFLISPDANGFSYTDYCESGEGVINKLPAVRGEQAQQDVYALTNFLTSRYADDTYGRITGIVIGRAADRAAQYSYTFAGDLATYVRLYATVLNLISVTAKQNIADACIVVPVSDRIFPDSVDEAELGREYYTAFFLPSLLAALRAQVMEPLTFSLMIESTSSPERVTGRASEGYGIDRIDELLALISRYADAYDFFDSRVMYSWIPDESASADALRATYLMLYLGLSRFSQVETFIADFSLAERSGESNACHVLAYLARYIDTDRFTEVSESAMTALRIGSVKELYEDLDEAALMRRRTYSVPLATNAYSGSVLPLGTYTPWNFTTATGALGWYAGSGCEGISVLTGSDGLRSLTATMDASNGYGDVAYHFQRPVDLSFAPMMRFDVKLDGDSNMRYEIRLQLYGESNTVTASSVIVSGEQTSLYFDMTSYKAALSAIRAFRISARPLDAEAEDFKLCLYTFTLESDVLNNADLAQRVNALQQGTAPSDTREEETRDYTYPLIISGVVVLASVAIVAFFILKDKTERLNRKRGHTEKKGS